MPDTKSRRSIAQDVIACLESDTLSPQYSLVKSLADGHCLTHSLSTITELSTTVILDIVIGFLAKFAHLYTDFIDALDLKKGLHEYVHSKRYNSNFCDILPKILCDCLEINLTIVCKIGGNVFIPILLDNDK